MRTASLLVVIPVGPGTNADFLRDTVESVLFYTGASRRLVIVDNTGAHACANLSRDFPDVDVVTTPEVFGKRAELYLTGSWGYLWALSRFQFDVVLRMDTDALVIGDAPEQDALAEFAKDPSIGALGSYLVDCNGEPRSFEAIGHQVQLEASLLPISVNPRRYGRYLLRRFSPRGMRGFRLYRHVYREAIANGYRPGEHFMGGAVFFSGECIRALAGANLLYRTDLRWSRLADDQLMSLLIISCGMKIGDFATGRLPMGLRWRGLPDSPEQLVARAKKVIHSTRFWKDMQEGEIRSFFRERRKRPCAPRATSSES